MNRKKINSLLKIIAALVAVIVAAILIIILAKSKIDEYEDNVNSLTEEIENNRQIVYVVKDGIEVKKGELVLSEGEKANVMKQEIYSGLEPEYYITDNEIGSIAIVDMEAGTPIMKNMVTTMSITHDTREYEVNVVDLMVDQKVNDYIDVRIMFPNGEDYLVLSKKQIKNLVLDSAIFYTYLNEEEILRLASATVDAYTMTGTKIYATRYVESNIQKEATPDYLVSAATMDRIVEDPNIVTLAQNTMNLNARLSLEQRLKGLTEEQLAAVAEGHGLTDTAKTSVLTNGVTFQLEDDGGEEENENENSSSNVDSDSNLSDTDTSVNAEKTTTGTNHDEISAVFEDNNINSNGNNENDNDN